MYGSWGGENKEMVSSAQQQEVRTWASPVILQAGKPASCDAEPSPPLNALARFGVPEVTLPAAVRPSLAA